MPEIEDFSIDELDFDGSLSEATGDLPGIELEDISIEDFNFDGAFDIEEETPSLPQLSAGEIDDPIEAEFAVNHPNVYAAGKTFQTVMQKLGSVAKYSPTDWTAKGLDAKANAGETVLEHAPFTKRMISPEARNKFWKLDQQHQTRALLWDTLETISFFPAAWRGAFSVIKAPFVPVGKAVNKIVQAKRLKPVEDVAMKQYGASKYYTEIAGRRQLKSMGFTDEAEMSAILNGDIKGFLGQRIAQEKKPISDAMRQSLEWVNHEPQLKPGVSHLLDPKVLRAKHYRHQWKQYGKKIFEDDWTPELESRVFSAHLERLVPGSKIKLDEASPELMKVIQRDMFLHPKVGVKQAKEMLSVYQKLWPDYISPVRVVFGTWEAGHKAYTGVYKVVKGGLGRANAYAMEKQLTLAKMWEQNGLGKVKIGKGGRVKFTPGFSKDQANKAYQALKELDELAAMGAKNPLFRQESMPRMAEEIMSKLSNTEKRIIQVHRDFNNSLYGEYVLEKIPQIFEQYTLTPFGQLGVEKLMAELAPKIGRAMSSGAGMSYEQRYALMQEVLETATGRLNHPWVKTMGRHPWFEGTGDKLNNIMKNLSRDLTMTNDQGTGRFIGYLENYVAKIGGRHHKFRQKWDEYLVPAGNEDPIGRFKGFFTKSRTNMESFDPISDFDGMIRGRIRAQANDLFMYPQVQKAIQHLQMVDAPRKLRTYTEHWISRILGRPSQWDVNIANMISRSGVENLPRLVGGGPWDERRVMQLASTINNINIQAGLGFKPFSLIRNMFQPLMLVPADLGGIKSIGHLARGMVKQLDPKFRTMVREMGAIGEFVPEVARTERMLPFGVGARADQVRDAALWMYKLSDRWNRYVTAGAAFEKWNAAVEAMGGIEKLSTLPNHMMKRFISKSGLKGRYPWMKDHIQDLISRGDINQARNEFIKDVVADTQFLYDIAESPVLPQTGGIVTKTASLFQSWWMNYGTLMEKWMRTGESGSAKANRLFTFMLSTAAAEQMLEPMFGESTAKRTVGLGVFPTEVNEFLIPAAWTPVYHGVIRMLPAVTFGEMDEVERQVKALSKSMYMFVPGGLQIKTFQNALEDDGFEGLAPAIFRFHQDKGYKPLWGMLD